MKNLIDIINESGWNPSLKYHKDAYNSFIKWYDKQLSHMNKDEILDMFEMIIQDIKDDELVPIK